MLTARNTQRAGTVERPVEIEMLDAGVIKDARRRQRRQWVVAAAALGILGALAVAVYLGARGSSVSPRSRASGHGASTTEGPAAVFAQDPSMGVACHVPSWIGCDRVGLAVWLRRPAIAVTATIAGAPLALDNPLWSGPSRNGRRTMFAGFLQPAGLTTRLHVVPDSGTQTWLGSNQPTPTVRFRIDYGHGKIVLTHEAVGLRAGWG